MEKKPDPVIATSSGLPVSVIEPCAKLLLTPLTLVPDSKDSNSTSDRLYPIVDTFATLFEVASISARDALKPDNAPDILIAHSYRNFVT